MDKEKLDSDMEQLLNQAQLKEPPEKAMSNYLEGVRLKIDRGIGKPTLMFSTPFLLAVAGLVLVGAAWFFLSYLHQPEKAAVLELKPLETVQPVKIVHTETSAKV